MFPGFASRINIEMKKLVKDNNCLKFGKHMDIINSSRRMYSAYIGLSVWSDCYNSPSYEDYWISKRDWEENGSKIIYKKCHNII